MSVKNWEKFYFGTPQYQKRIGWNGRAVLHHNSKQLKDIINDQNLLFDGINIFEIGAGGNRNLKYINDLANEKGININLASNDLHREESLAETHESIKDKVNFYESDTLSLVENWPTIDNKPLKVDLLISSDHLMHIEKNAGVTILAKIKNEIKPQYILLREVKKEYENLSHPRFYHNYDTWLDNYELTYETDGSNNENGSWYMIRIYKRK